MFPDNPFFNVANCSIAFKMADLNANNFIGLHEAIVATYQEWGIASLPHWQQKLDQIDCSMCLRNSSLYYW